MGKQKSSTQIDHEAVAVICHQLCNPRKIAVINYVRYAGMATASVIQRKLQLNQPSVSKYLRSLTACGLLTKEKYGYTMVYSANPEAWDQFTAALNDLGT